MKILFYNAHQNGDIILSRQGVRWIIDNLGKNHQYFYLHNKKPKSIFIHENVEVFSIDGNFHGSPMQIMKRQLKNQLLNECLWVDSWLGSLHNGGFVVDETEQWIFLLNNENGQRILGECTEVWDSIDWQTVLWKQNVDIINDALSYELTNKRLPYPKAEDLIPKWSGQTKNSSIIDEFISKNKNKKFILICNSEVTSNQRKNTNFELILEPLYETYKDFIFCFTDKINDMNYDNVCCLSDLLPLPNLNEIEYFSKFCSVLTTSMSGPGCMVLNDAVFSDPQKTLIYFTRDVLGKYYEVGQCKYLHTSDFSDESILEIFKKGLENVIK